MKILSWKDWNTPYIFTIKNMLAQDFAFILELGYDYIFTDHFRNVSQWPFLASKKPVVNQKAFVKLACKTIQFMCRIANVVIFWLTASFILYREHIIYYDNIILMTSLLVYLVEYVLYIGLMILFLVLFCLKDI